MEFKQLDLKPEGNALTRMLKSRQTRRTLLAILIGAVVGFTWFYLSEGRHYDQLLAGDILKSMAIGGFFGFFITNSPCARGRC